MCFPYSTDGGGQLERKVGNGQVSARVQYYELLVSVNILNSFHFISLKFFAIEQPRRGKLITSFAVSVVKKFHNTSLTYHVCLVMMK